MPQEEKGKESIWKRAEGPGSISGTSIYEKTFKLCRISF